EVGWRQQATAPSGLDFNIESLLALGDVVCQARTLGLLEALGDGDGLLRRRRGGVVGGLPGGGVLGPLESGRDARVAIDGDLRFPDGHPGDPVGAVGGNLAVHRVTVRADEGDGAGGHWAALEPDCAGYLAHVAVGAAAGGGQCCEQEYGGPWWRAA